MSEQAPDSSRQQISAYLRSAWLGHGQLRPRGSVLFGILALAIASLIYSVSLSVLSWPPIAFVGWGLLLLTGLVGWLGLRSLWRAVRRLGLRGLLIRAGVAFVVATVLIAMLVPSDKKGIAHILGSMGRVLSWVGERLDATWTTLLNAPGEMAFIVSGRRPPLRVPSVEWEGNVPPTPITMELLSQPPGGPAPEATSQAAVPTPPDSLSEPGQLSVGITARVAKTNGSNLRIRSKPSPQAAIVARLAEGTRVTILEGPAEYEGLVWWKVRTEAVEGWCAADFLVPAE